MDREQVLRAIRERAVVRHVGRDGDVEYGRIVRVVETKHVARAVFITRGEARQDRMGGQRIRFERLELVAPSGRVLRVA